MNDNLHPIFKDILNNQLQLPNDSVKNTWELTEEERNKLSNADRIKYDTAVEYKGHDWACGSWGGWSRGNDLLIELGWEQVKRTEGHRQFISLVKPKNIRIK